MDAWFLLGFVVALSYAANPLTTRYLLRKKGSSAIAMSTVTAVFSFLIVLAFFATMQIGFTFSQDLILFGLVSAVLTTAASLLWAYATKTKEASYVSPLLQTDSLFALLLSVLLLSEPLTPANLLGVLTIFAGGFIINSSKGAPRLSLALFVIVLSAFLSSLNYFTVKLGTVAIIPISLALVSNGFRVPLYGGLAALFRQKQVRSLWSEALKDKHVLLAILGKSLCTALIVIAMFYALSLGVMAKVVAIAGTAPLFVVVLGFLLLKEKETFRRLVGSAIIILGAFLVYL